MNFDADEIERLNKTLQAELSASEKESFPKSLFSAVSNVVQFWDEFIGHGWALDRASYELRKYLDEAEFPSVQQARWIFSITQSKFWAGEAEDLPSTEHMPNNQLFEAAKLVLQSSSEDAAYFSEEDK